VKRDLKVTVVEVRGHCPVYQVGDHFTIRDGYQLELSEGQRVCMHGLASLLPYYVALSRGADPEELGLRGPRPGCAYVQCLDPEFLTGGGTVVFEIERVP